MQCGGDRHRRLPSLPSCAYIRQPGAEVVAMSSVAVSKIAAIVPRLRVSFCLALVRRPHSFTPSPASLSARRMPPIQRPATTEKSIHAWTTGNKRSIAHVELIGKGGFGEVHKVQPVISKYCALTGS